MSHSLNGYNWEFIGTAVGRDNSLALIPLSLPDIFDELAWTRCEDQQW